MENVTSHNLRDNLRFKHTRSESKVFLTRPVLFGIVYQFSRVMPNSSSFNPFTA